MAESTLALSKADLENEIGDYAGFGPTSASWSGDAAKVARVARALKAGLRMVYFPQEMEGVPGGYPWSFLKPVADVTLADGAATVTLADDFGGIEGEIIPASAAGESQWPVTVTGVGEVYRREASQPNTTGRPVIACVEPVRGSTLAEGQRFQLRVWPTADQAYTLQVRYYVLPDAVTDLLPYVYGGAAHAETFKKACRAAYERDFDGIADGPEMMDFVVRLKASVAYDRKFKPQTLGYNGDASDLAPAGPHADPAVWRFNGVTPD